MDQIPRYQIQNSSQHIDISTLRSKIAIDKSPIAPFKKLNIGDKLSVAYSSIKNPPLPLKPFVRAMKSRSESTLSTLPLVITQLVQSGPDADFTMSIEALTAITSALCFDSPLALVFYNINDRFFFDEPLHHESHPWSQLFIQNKLQIDSSSVENVSMLSTIASCAFDETKKPNWFSNLKGDVITSERSQQRWYRDTEKYLPMISEDFSRSFLCGIPDVSLHIGSNSVICDINESEPAIIRYSKGDPTEMQSYQWTLEGLLTSCKNILLTSSESMTLTRYEIEEMPKLNNQRLSSIFGLLRYIKKYSTEFGCYMLHKRSKSDAILLRKATENELETAKLTKSYQMRISLLLMMIGYRHILSTNINIIENGRKLLFKAINYSTPLHKSLCYERIGDSLILPILLLDRTKSLISTTTRKTAEQIQSNSYDEAINCYNHAMESENLPDSLVISIHHKLATTKFAKAILTRNDELAKESMKIEDVDHEFQYNVAIWRCKNALELTEMVNNPNLNSNLAKHKNNKNSANSGQAGNLNLLNSSSSSSLSSSQNLNTNFSSDYDSESLNQMAQSLAYSALSIAETEEEKIEPKRLLAIAFNAEAQSNVVVQRYTHASKRFLNAHSLFDSIDDKEHLAETEANLASIERCLANNASITHKGKFTHEEERRLMSAAKYYLTAIDRVSQISAKTRDDLSLDLASLYRSIVVRYTQMPPLNRMKPEQIIEEVHRCISEASNLLNKLLNGDTNNSTAAQASPVKRTAEIQKQIAALNTWHAKFISEFELKHVESVLSVKRQAAQKKGRQDNQSKPDQPEHPDQPDQEVDSKSGNSSASFPEPSFSPLEIENEKQHLISTARTLFTKARQFLIADSYPADFVSITLSLASLKLACGQPLDAMRTMMDCLKALRPTSIIVRPKNQGIQLQQQQQQQHMQSQQSQQSQSQQSQQAAQQSQSLSISRSVLNNMLPNVLEMIRSILKEMTLDKFKRKLPCDFEKGLYKCSLETREDGVVNLMLELKKSLKL